MQWIIIALLLCTLTVAQADTVYLCKRNGKPLYTSSPAGDDCRPIEVKVLEPNPAEVERMRREQQRWEAERQAAEERDREERRVRAQEDAARAAERSAELAEENARYQRELLLRQQRPVYQAPYFIYPAAPYPYIPGFPHHRPPPGGGGGWRPPPPPHPPDASRSVPAP